MRLIISAICFYIFWKGLDNNQTALAFIGLIASVALLMWQLFESWMSLGLIFA